MDLVGLIQRRDVGVVNPVGVTSFNEVRSKESLQYYLAHYKGRNWVAFKTLPLRRFRHEGRHDDTFNFWRGASALSEMKFAVPCPNGVHDLDNHRPV